MTGVLFPVSDMELTDVNEQVWSLMKKETVRTHNIRSVTERL